MGAHAVGALTEPRATVDFDFVVEADKIPDVLALLENAFGDLDAVDIGAAVSLRAIDVDLIRSKTHSLFGEALDRTQPAGQWRIPVSELLIVLKFLSAVNPWRAPRKRRRDAVDLADLYEATAPAGLDRDLMRDFASQVYPGAEEDFDRLLDRIDRGEPFMD